VHEADGEIGQLEGRYRGASWANKPAALRALAEAREGQILTLYMASRPYASVSSAADGLHYLGKSATAVEIALFHKSLRFSDVAAVPTLFLFDGAGNAAGTWFGAPRDLHEQVEKRLGVVAGKSGK